MKDVRVRFAPSPTGYLHVGGLRTALYNYLFAKHFGGKMILRIEDTDQSRFVEGAVDNLINSLRWAGIEFDESPEVGGKFGPYVQSERFELYRKHAQILLDKGHAYYAFDTPEELLAMRTQKPGAVVAPKYDRLVMKNQYTLGAIETKRLMDMKAPYVIRLRIPPDAEITFTDIIRGDITVLGWDVDDQILLKSDGYPTYHLANVVDDHFMEISHIIRGEEWLPSTPKHAFLYDAFGWERPEFAHLPLLLNTSKQKLSKRQGDVAVEDFRAKGYFRSAFVNFIALLGFNPTGDREIYTIEELIEYFDLSKVNKSGAVFDLTKLEWMNTQYIKIVPTSELVELARPALESAGFGGFDDEYVGRVINLVKERIHFMNELPDFVPYMFGDIKEFEIEYIKKRWEENSKEIALDLIEIYKKDDVFNHDSLYGAAKAYAEEKGIKLGPITHPLRIMTTGKSVGAGAFETMEVLGKETCIQRMEKFIELWDSGTFI
ncbi:MAG: glutamate--tRNA ligase [bacterium]